MHIRTPGHESLGLGRTVMLNLQHFNCCAGKQWSHDLQLLPSQDAAQTVYTGRVFTMRQISDARIAASLLHVKKQARRGQYELFQICAWVSNVLLSFVTCMNIQFNAGMFCVTAALIVALDVEYCERYVVHAKSLEFPLQVAWAVLAHLPGILLTHGLVCFCLMRKQRRAEAEWSSSDSSALFQVRRHCRYKGLQKQICRVLIGGAVTGGVLNSCMQATLQIQTLRRMELPSRFGTQWGPATGPATREIRNAKLAAHLAISSTIGKKTFRKLGLDCIRKGDWILVNNIPMIPTHASREQLQMQEHFAGTAVIRLRRDTLLCTEQFGTHESFCRIWTQLNAIDILLVETLDRPCSAPILEHQAQVMNALLRAPHSDAGPLAPPLRTRLLGGGPLTEQHNGVEAETASDSAQLAPLTAALAETPATADEANGMAAMQPQECSEAGAGIRSAGVQFVVDTAAREGQDGPANAADQMDVDGAFPALCLGTIAESQCHIEAKFPTETTAADITVLGKHALARVEQEIIQIEAHI